MNLRDKLGKHFNTHIEDVLKLFDSIIKPILLYSSDFWECLNLPKNNPIENLHFTFCKHLLGVQRGTTNVGVLLELCKHLLGVQRGTTNVGVLLELCKHLLGVQRGTTNAGVLLELCKHLLGVQRGTTNVGVLLELCKHLLGVQRGTTNAGVLLELCKHLLGVQRGTTNVGVLLELCKHLLGVQRGTTNAGVLLELRRTLLTLDAQKAAINHWERIRNKKANYLVTLSYKHAEQNSLEWSTKVKSCLEQNGMLSSYTREPPHPCLNTHTKLYKRLADVFYQSAFESINKHDSKLRTCSLIKESVEIENYLITTRNINARVCLTKFRLSNHKLMIETRKYLKQNDSALFVMAWLKMKYISL